MLPPNRGHPLSQAVRPASSPIGEPSPTSPERGERRIAPEGSGAVCRIPFEMHQGKFAEAPCCPLWGWCSAQRIKIVMIAGGNHTSVSCRGSGKRGVVGISELLPFIERHPLSQAVRPASSPTGEPSPTSPERGGRRIAPEGSGAVCRIPFEMHQGEFAEAPCCPLWGWCSAQRIRIAMIAGGNHTSVSCRGSGKGGGVGDFELLPFIEQHPLSQPCRFRSAVKSASSPIGEPRNCAYSPRIL